MIGSERQFAKSLLKWYRGARRDLPWRAPLAIGVSSPVLPDAYHVLLSEVMLQQTQVATVIPYFRRFLEHFPTIQHLADADTQHVLRLWQGLGYYSRARNLHQAAKVIVDRHGGVVPRKVEQLLALPGIGRYTAGAIASQAYNERAPIVDCNVQRVLCRLDAVMEDPRQRDTAKRLWQRAEAILPRKYPGDFNSALMELGATVCTSRAPSCLTCPVRASCEATEKGLQQQIPPPKPKIARPLERRWVFCIEHDGRWLIEQRPAVGRWAGMWQFVTVARGQGKATAKQASIAAGVIVESFQPLGTVAHGLTHRQYEFDAFRAVTRMPPVPRKGRAWVTLKGLTNYPLPKPHVRLAAMLAMAGG